MNPAFFWPILGGCIAALLIAAACCRMWRRKKAGVVRKAVRATAAQENFEDPSLTRRLASGASLTTNRPRNPGLYGACMREGEPADMTHVRARVSRAREVNQALDLSSRKSSVECCEAMAFESGASGEGHMAPRACSSSHTKLSRPAACIRITESRLSNPGRSTLSFSRRRDALSNGFGKQWRPSGSIPTLVVPDVGDRRRASLRTSMSSGRLSIRKNPGTIRVCNSEEEVEAVMGI